MNIDTLAKVCDEIELVDKDFIRSSFHPYVYFVKGKKGSKFENKFYIGSKSKVNVRDTNGVIGEDYFTSSSQKEFVDDFTLHPENYQSTIIHTSDDYGAEYQIEQKLIEATLSDESSLNKCVYKNAHITLESYDLAIERMKDTKSKWSEERRALYKERYQKSLALRSKEHEELVKGNIAEGRKKMWAKRTEDERKAIANKISQARKNKSAEEKAATRLKLQAAAKAQSERMTEEQKAEANAKRAASSKKKFVALKEAYATYKKNGGELKWNEWQKLQKRS